jgi:hypothetical protein
MTRPEVREKRFVEVKTVRNCSIKGIPVEIKENQRRD